MAGMQQAAKTASSQDGKQPQRMLEPVLRLRGVVVARTRPAHSTRPTRIQQAMAMARAGAQPSQLPGPVESVPMRTPPTHTTAPARR